MKDVAKYAGVSIATVSKYINGGNVLDENEAQIEEAIESLNYKRNEIARGLKTNQTMTVGVLIPSLKEIFFTSIVSHIEDILQDKGYSMIVCDYREDKELQKSKVEFLLKKMVDGIIFVPYGNEIELVEMVKEDNIPIVLLDRMIPDTDCDAVVTDSVNGSYNAVEELFKRGHKRVGIITGPESIYTSRERLKGYKRVHKDYNQQIDENLIQYGDYDIQGGYENTLNLLELNPLPSAIFVTNYEMTVGSLMAINEKGIKIPDEISFIGFDNIMQMSQIINPSLSIVSQPMEEIGETTAEILIKRLRGDNSNFPGIYRLKTEVLIKESVRDLRKF